MKVAIVTMIIVMIANFISEEFLVESGEPIVVDTFLQVTIESLHAIRQSELLYYSDGFWYLYWKQFIKHSQRKEIPQMMSSSEWVLKRSYIYTFGPTFIYTSTYAWSEWMKKTTHSETEVFADNNNIVRVSNADFQNTDIPHLEDWCNSIFLF